MRLYLSSYKFGSKPQQLIDLVGNSNRNVGIIPSAADAHKPADVDDWYESDAKVFARLGYIPHRIDLRQYFGEKYELWSLLKALGMVWVQGGNVFTLRRAMRASAFDVIITEMLQNDEIAYGGFSAGAVVVGPSLAGFELVDEPDQLIQGYPTKLYNEGLGLTDFVVVPHWESDHPESKVINKVVKYLDKNEVVYQTLSDGEVIIINGDKKSLVD